MLARHPLVAECAALGIALSVQGDGLVVEPAERMTPALRARLVEAKPVLLAALADFPGAGKVQAADHAGRIVRGKLHAYAATLAARDYTFDERRLRARARRDLGEALGYRSLTAARRALGSEADVRASLLLDGWFAALEDDDDLLGGAR